MKSAAVCLLLSLPGSLFFCSRNETSIPDPQRTGTVDSRSPEELFAAGKKFYDQQQYEEAAPLMTAAAERGNAEAQMHLGKMYFNGWGVPHDHAKAIEWHKKAAARGNQESIQKLKKMEH